jgi:hypothetical protein
VCNFEKRWTAVRSQGVLAMDEEHGGADIPNGILMLQPNRERLGMTTNAKLRLWLSTLIVAATAVACSSCGSPTAPSSGATVSIENFTATYFFGHPANPGTFVYDGSMRVREVGGVAATITGLTLTVIETQQSRNYSPTDMLGTSMLPANGVLPSSVFILSGVTVPAGQLTVRVTYVGADGRTGTAQATATAKLW